MRKQSVRKTLLLVGEGHSEEAFMNHVKLLFLKRDGNLIIKIKNAQGKGAKHVLDWAIGQTRNTSYDAVAVMLDTDTSCWDEAKLRKKAKEHRIELLTSEPCFEAMMLRVLGQPDQGNAKALKKCFMPFVDNEPTLVPSYTRHFTKALLVKTMENSIQLLLKLIDSLIS